MAPPGGADLVLVQLTNDALSSPQRLAIRTLAEAAGVRLFPELDAALEWAEGQLLATALPGKAPTALSLARLEMFHGLSTAECKTLERIAQPFRFEKGHVIVRQGDAARLLFVVGLGTVSVWLNLKEGRRRRIACIGPASVSAKWRCSTAAGVQPTSSPTRRRSATASQSPASRNWARSSPTS